MLKLVWKDGTKSMHNQEDLSENHYKSFTQLLPALAFDMERFHFIPCNSYNRILK